MPRLLRLLKHHDRAGWRQIQRETHQQDGWDETMNLLTQLTAGEVLEFLNAFEDNTILIPSWSRGISSEEDPNRLCFARTSRGTVRTLRHAILQALRRERQGVCYTHDTLIDVRHHARYDSLTLGMLIAAIRPWSNIGELQR